MPCYFRVEYSPQALDLTKRQPRPDFPASFLVRPSCHCVGVTGRFCFSTRFSNPRRFGQPRVGDWSFAWYLHNKLNVPELRYVRLIYANDLVPRVPYDDCMVQYKHLEPFHWSSAFYDVTVGHMPRF